MKRVFRIQGKGKVKDVGLRGLAECPELERVNTTVALIQALVPLGLRAAGEALAAEVTQLAGPKHSRTEGSPGYVRWCHQRGSIYLADQKLPVTYQRVRDLRRNAEVPLATYQQLQRPRAADAGLFRKILLGLSCRDYEACAEAVPEAFGLSPSTVSRRFIRASATQLRTLHKRRLDTYDVVALVLDGKTFAEDEMVIALGITASGEKVLLGFVQTATENEIVCAAFLRELVERGLRTDQGLLIVIDGAKGIRKAVQTVFGAQAVIQRSEDDVIAAGVGDVPAVGRGLQVGVGDAVAHGEIQQGGRGATVSDLGAIDGDRLAEAERGPFRYLSAKNRAEDPDPESHFLQTIQTREHRTAPSLRTLKSRVHVTSRPSRECWKFQGVLTEDGEALWQTGRWLTKSPSRTGQRRPPYWSVLAGA